MLYIKDHNGNKLYFKLYCVILDELSVFTTFLSNKNKQTNKQRLVRNPGVLCLDEHNTVSTSDASVVVSHQAATLYFVTSHRAACIQCRHSVRVFIFSQHLSH